MTHLIFFFFHGASVPVVSVVTGRTIAATAVLTIHEAVPAVLRATEARPAVFRSAEEAAGLI